MFALGPVGERREAEFGGRWRAGVGDGVGEGFVLGGCGAVEAGWGGFEGGMGCGGAKRAARVVD